MSTTDERTKEKQPNAAAALDQYRHAAPGYDRHMRRFARWQQMAVERIDPVCRMPVDPHSAAGSLTYEGRE